VLEIDYVDDQFYIDADKLLVLKDNKFIVYNPANGQMISSDDIDNSLEIIQIVHVNDRYLVAYSDKRVPYLWDWISKSFKSLSIFDGISNEIRAPHKYQVAFLENDKLVLIASRSSDKNQCLLEMWKISEYCAEKLAVKERSYVCGVKALLGCKFALISPQKVEVCSENLEVINQFEIEKCEYYSIESISNEFLMFNHWNKNIEDTELTIYNFQKGQVVKRLKMVAFNFFVTWDSKFLVAVSQGLLQFYDMVEFNLYNQAESRFSIEHIDDQEELIFLREKEYFISVYDAYGEIKVFKSC